MSASITTVSADGRVDLRAITLMLWRARRWILLSVLAFTALFVAAAFLMQPVYRAATVLVAANPDHNGLGGAGSALGQLGGLASLAGINLVGTASRVEETIAVLRSRELTEGFLRDNALLPVLYPERWDNARKDWIPGEEQPTLAQAYKHFDEDIRKIVFDKKTGLVTLEVEWRDPETAARWANQLVERVNGEMRARAIERTNASVGYLEKELAATTAIDTREAINRLMEAQINERMFANVTHEYSLRVVDRALPPDPKDIVRPKKLLLIALGPVLGLGFGAFAVLVIAGLPVPPRDPRPA